jgi:hypothetical protein
MGDIPLFVRGGILPLKTMASISGDFPDPLVWALFPGSASGSYSVYEDSGDSDAYQGGEFARTAASFSGDVGKDSAISLSIAPSQVQGALPAGFPQSRGHVLQLRGLRGRTPSSVTVNGVPVQQAAEGTVPGWFIAAEHSLAQPEGALVVSTGQQSSWASTSISVVY